MQIKADLMADIMSAIDDLMAASDDREKRRYQRALVHLIEELERMLDKSALLVEQFSVFLSHSYSIFIPPTSSASPAKGKYIAFVSKCPP